MKLFEVSNDLRFFVNQEIPSDIDSHIAEIEEEQEDIDSRVISYENSNKDASALSQEYQGLEVIKTVITNYTKARARPELFDNNMFVIVFNTGNWAVGALHCSVSNGVGRINWIGSLTKGLGTALYARAKQWMKQKGASKATVNSKYDSEPFHTKMGARKTKDTPESGIFGGQQAEFEMDV